MSVNKKIIETEAAVADTANFDVLLYTGDRPTNAPKTGVGFKPDLIWIKGRNQTDFWSVLDSTRGANVLSCDATQTESSFSGFTFDTDGFTVLSSGQANSNGEPYVSYHWRANGGTTSSNTDGSITSTIQASNASGFSIVTWTGNSSNASIGHGLSSAPEMIIAKSRTVAQNWAVYHKDAGNTYWLQLNSTTARLDEAIWQDTTPSSSVFYVNGNVVINSGNSVAYCFHSVSGFSKFGSYSGTSSSGNSINVGFAPNWVLIKGITAGSAWVLHDTVRSDGTKHLRPNSNSGEDSGANEQINFTSTGFSIKNSGATQINTSGHTYIYAAFKLT